MAKKEKIIAPQLRLPAKPVKRRKAPRRSRRQTLFIIVRELVFLVIALDLGNLAYWYLAPWPIYRIVAFVILFVLWSNVASGIARGKTKQALDMLNTMSTQAVRAIEHSHKHTAIVKQESNQDTTGYLEAIKKEHHAHIQTHRLHNFVPHDHRNSSVLDHHEAPPS